MRRIAPAKGAAASLIIPVHATAAAPDLPGLGRVVTLQIYRQHDRQCVRDNRRNVVPVHVRCDVLASFPARQIHSQPHQAERANQKSQCIAGQQVGHAERNRNAHRNQQEHGDDHLREVETHLRNDDVDIAAPGRPPTVEWRRTYGCRRCHGPRLNLERLQRLGSKELLRRQQAL